MKTFCLGKRFLTICLILIGTRITDGIIQRFILIDNYLSHLLLLFYTMEQRLAFDRIFLLYYCSLNIIIEIKCFEGMKAYKDSAGKIRLFRPEMNMARLNSSMARLSMPTFSGDQLIACIKELLKVDADWVPDKEGYSIYLRPTAIGTSPFLGATVILNTL